MRGHSDRVYTDFYMFAKESVRDVRASSACDIALAHQDNFYTLQVLYRGSEGLRLQVQCDGEPIAEVETDRASKQVSLTVLKTISSLQKELADLVVQQVSELYFDLL